MNLLRLSIRALGALLLGFAATAHAGDAPRRLLFVGNSLTYYNDLPHMVQGLLAAIDTAPPVQVDMLAQGGATLRERLDDGRLAAVLDRGHYDGVVLQDKGGYPLCAETDLACRDSPAAIAEAVRLVRAHGAAPLLYATWQALPEAQARLSRATSAAVRGLDVPVADAGAAMHWAKAHGTHLALWLPDGHPDLGGSWLAAAQIVRTLRGHDLPPLHLDRVCRQRWRNREISAQRLASEQTPASETCEAPAQELLDAVRAAANASADASRRRAR